MVMDYSQNIIRNITYVTDLIKQFKPPPHGYPPESYPVDIGIHPIEGDLLVGGPFGVCPLMGVMFKPKPGEELDDYRLYLVTKPFHGVIKVYVWLENPYKIIIDRFTIEVEIDIH